MDDNEAEHIVQHAEDFDEETFNEAMNRLRDRLARTMEKE